MKIAKKVLAVAMAVAMIACFAAMAFAANDKVVLNVSEIEDGAFTLSVIVKDADLKTADWDIYYDTAALEVAEEDEEDLIYFGDGVSKAVNKGKIMGQWNDIEAEGKILVAITTTEGLGADVGKSFDAATGADLLCVDFNVIKADAANVKIVVTEKDNKEVVVAETVLFPKEEETTAAPVEETTAAPVEETTAAEAPSTPVETTTAAANDSAGNLGDTGALAIAAGVVALAGAAFVVTKKRK